MARHGALQATGSYKTGGRSSLGFRGVYNAEIGTTVLVASIRDDGHTFHDNRTPWSGESQSKLIIAVARKKGKYHRVLRRPRSQALSRCKACIAERVRGRCRSQVADNSKSFVSPRIDLQSHAIGLRCKQA
jgi:hypothetical protein